MSDAPTDEGTHRDAPVIRDKRRLDPQTGKVRQAYSVAEFADAPVPGEMPVTGDPVAAGDEGPTSAPEPVAVADEAVVAESELVLAQDRAAEHLADLQRVQAEYVNYRRRVERDREVARDQAITSVLESLLPVLDDVHLARQHGDLIDGPFAAIVEKLEMALSRHGLERYGEAGETFDPKVHEALIHTEAELPTEVTETTVVQVLQPGYRIGERVVRPARVAVADPGGRL